MPTELGPAYEITWRGRPAHMLNEDVPVWHRFLDMFAPDFQRFYYDVRVGGPNPAQVYPDPKFGRMWWQITAKRIDALAEKESELWLIEVATRPGLRSIGQLTSYIALWALNPPIQKPVLGYLVCDILDPDLAFALKSNNLRFLTV